LVGADGATHHGAFDLSYLRCVPNMTVMTPADENECRQMLYTGFTLDTPAAVRYPRGAGAGVAIEKDMHALPIGKGELRREGRRVAILAFGTLLKTALEVGAELDATVANMRFVKPLDDELVAQLARGHGLLVTLEENVVMGGAGSAVAESLAARGIVVPLLHLGLPDRFVDHGDQNQLLASVGLDREGILAAIRARLAAGAPPASIRAA
jgi:1-deoxy-D-xylulose-5-phosphate synthase